MFGSSMASFNSAEPRPTSRPAPPRGPPVPNASSAAADPLRSKLGPGRTEVGYVATRASAKMNEYKGYCLALVVHGRLVRPCKPLRFGDAAPFWSEADVEGLEVGMPVQLTAAAASSGSSYPHAFEDVEVEGGTLTPMPRAKRKSLGELLPQICQPSLETVWPADVWNDRSESGGSNSVRDGSHVPSLTVVKGEVVRYGTPEKPDKQRAQIVTECGIKLCAKVTSKRIQTDLLAVGHNGERRWKGYLLLGLARANLDYHAQRGTQPSCELLLVGGEGSLTPLARPVSLSAANRGGPGADTRISGVGLGGGGDGQESRGGLEASPDEHDGWSGRDEGRGQGRDQSHDDWSSGEEPQLPARRAPPPSKAAAQASPKHAPPRGGAPAVGRVPGMGSARAQAQRKLVARVKPAAAPAHRAAFVASPKQPQPIAKKIGGRAAGRSGGRGGAARSPLAKVRQSVAGGKAGRPTAGGTAGAGARAGARVCLPPVAGEESEISDGAEAGSSNKGGDDETDAEYSNGSDDDEVAEANREMAAGLKRDAQLMELELRHGNHAVEAAEAAEEEEEDATAAAPRSDALVGKRVRVQWEGPSDEDGDEIPEWYAGTVKSFSSKRGHCITYDDGEIKYHRLDDPEEEVWELESAFTRRKKEAATQQHARQLCEKTARKQAAAQRLRDADQAPRLGTNAPRPQPNAPRPKPAPERRPGAVAARPSTGQEAGAGAKRGSAPGRPQPAQPAAAAQPAGGAPKRQKIALDASSDDEPSECSSEDDEPLTARAKSVAALRRSEREGSASGAGRASGGAAPSGGVSGTDEVEEVEYQVEAILACRQPRAAHLETEAHYQVRWAGWGWEDDTWEPHSAVEHTFAFEKWQAAADAAKEEAAGQAAERGAAEAEARSVGVAAEVVDAGMQVEEPHEHVTPEGMAEAGEARVPTVGEEEKEGEAEFLRVLAGGSRGDEPPVGSIPSELLAGSSSASGRNEPRAGSLDAASAAPTAVAEAQAWQEQAWHVDGVDESGEDEPHPAADTPAPPPPASTAPSQPAVAHQAAPTSQPAAPPPRKLGCSKCRHSPKGCKACRPAGWQPPPGASGRGRGGSRGGGPAAPSAARSSQTAMPASAQPAAPAAMAAPAAPAATVAPAPAAAHARHPKVVKTRENVRKQLIVSDQEAGDGFVWRRVSYPDKPLQGERICVEWDEGWFSGDVVMCRSMIDPLGPWEVFEFKVKYDDGDVKWHMTEETCFRVKRRGQLGSRDGAPAVQRLAMGRGGKATG